MATVRPAQATRFSRTAGGRPSAAYRPMAHPGRPRSWNRGSIREALLAWSAETGQPPRRNDWTGERPGEAGRAQRKWMVEHPRWPSSSCVSAHFGSWSAALDDADLPVRRLTFDSSVSERVDAARRLAVSGLSPREISGLLGVSVSSVHNYIRARDCPDCGGPVTNPHAARCAACAVRYPTVNRVWSRADVRAAIRAWQAEHGYPPSYRDWTPSRASPGRWEAESPRWPSAAVVCGLYRARPNPWNAALIDAGADVRFQRWSDDSVRSALAGFWIETGRSPHGSDLVAGHWPGPHPVTLRRRYGSVDAAWRALGPAAQSLTLRTRGCRVAGPLSP